MAVAEQLDVSLVYAETGRDGKRKHTVAQIAAEFGVSRPTIYRHLAKSTD